MEDQAIITLFQERDELAISETDKKYGRKLLKLINRILFDTHAAEECVNDTYLRVWHLIPPENPENYFFRFLSRISRGLAIDRYRKDRRLAEKAEILQLSEELDAVLGGSDVVSEHVEGQELTRSLNRFLRSLPEEKRKIFLRRYWFMDTVAEIAERYHITEGKVKTILFRTRNELKIYLTKEGYYL